MKTTTFRSSCLMIVLAGALAAPARLFGQRVDSTRTHVVKPGDTLWNLAATYLGDSQRWREILALNTSVRAANSLPVGSTIRIPVRGTTRPRTADVAKPATPAADSALPSPTPPVAGPDTVRRTIFFGATPAGGFASRDTVRPVLADSAMPARVFEAVSAPFVTDSGAFERGGRCVSVGPAASSQAGGVLLQGTLSILVPAGAPAPAGSRWLLVRRGPMLAGLGAVAIPTGIVRLTSAGGTGAASTAEVVAQFDAMSCTDVVLPDLPSPAVRGGRLTPVTDGARGRIAWIASESQLPTLQHALILDIGATAGVRQGDRVTIYGGDGSAVVASADVVRVDQRSATALVVHQSLGSLAAGLSVRVTEKLP